MAYYLKSVKPFRREGCTRCAVIETLRNPQGTLTMDSCEAKQYGPILCERKSIKNQTVRISTPGTSSVCLSFSVCLWLCVCVSLCLSLSVCLSQSLSVCLCLCLSLSVSHSLSLSVCLRLSLSLSVSYSLCVSLCLCLSVCLCLPLSVSPSPCVSVCLSVSVSPSLSVCLCLSLSVCLPLQQIQIRINVVLLLLPSSSVYSLGNLDSILFSDSSCFILLHLYEVYFPVLGFYCFCHQEQICKTKSQLVLMCLSL